MYSLKNKQNEIMSAKHCEMGYKNLELNHSPNHKIQRNRFLDIFFNF